MKFAEITLRYSNSEYRKFKQIEAWNSSLSKFDQENRTNIQEPVEFSLNNWLIGVCDRKKESDKKREEHSIDTSAIELIKKYYQVDSVFEAFDRKIIEEHGNFHHPYLQGIKYDMDIDGKEEIICFVGSILSRPTMMVFAKNKKDDYEKIYELNLWLHNEYPYLKKIENTASSLKLIRTGGFYYRGSGHWLYVYSYLKKIDDEIILVFETPYRANDHMSFDYLNSNAHLLSDSIITENIIELQYSYKTTGSYRLFEELNNDPKEEIELIENDNLIITLNWNEDLNKFSDGNNEQIEALMKIENDSLQWRAFGNLVDQSINKEIINYLNERIK